MTIALATQEVQEIGFQVYRIVVRLHTVDARSTILAGEPVDSANPRFVLASSAIRCRFVDRFVRLKVLSRDWDRSRARPAVGEGFPFLLFRLQDGFTVPPWLTFPEAPL